MAKKVQNAEHGHTKDSLLKALLQALKDLIGKDLELSSHDSINDIFVSANACLQNFPYGHEILGESLELLVPLLPWAWSVTGRTLGETENQEVAFFV